MIDRTPRRIDREEAATLADLASIVVDELELRLAARREAERLEQTRTDFVVTASHELRTPLTAVFGAAKTLAASADSLPELERELVRMIESQSERLNDIVEKILLAAQIETAAVPLALELHDAVALARRALELVKPVAAARTLTLAVAGPIPPVIADATRLRLVLVNLLENAVKYSQDGSEIELEVANGEGRVRFLVHDEGIGIPERDQRRIFDKFVRLDPNQSSGIAGTGLGLHIARSFVRGMGGTLTVSSAPGRGSTFVVELPAAAG